MNKVSFEEIGAVAATFFAQKEVKAGPVSYTHLARLTPLPSTQRLAQAPPPSFTTSPVTSGGTGPGWTIGPKTPPTAAL